MAELADYECVACTSEDEPLTSDEYTEYYQQIGTKVWNAIDEHLLSSDRLKRRCEQHEDPIFLLRARDALHSGRANERSE